MSISELPSKAKLVRRLQKIDGHKIELIKENGFKSIVQARKNFLGKTDKQIYDILFYQYNKAVDDINEGILEQREREKKERARAKKPKKITKIDVIAERIMDEVKTKREAVNRRRKEVKRVKKEDNSFAVRDRYLTGILNSINPEGGAIRLDDLKTAYMTDNETNNAIRAILNKIYSVCGKTLINIDNGKIMYALNDYTIQNFSLNKAVGIDGLSGGVDGMSGSNSGSDQALMQAIKDHNREGYLEYTPIRKAHKNEVVSGAFFKYMHSTTLDLTRYGIYKKDDNPDYRDTCLVFALKELGLFGEQLETLCGLIKTRIVPVSSLEMLCIATGIQINLKKENDKKHVKRYGSEDDEIFNVYDIANIDGHYFVNEKTDITRFAFENMEELKDKQDWKTIYKKKGNSYCRDKTRTISSFELVELLLENKDKYLEEYSYENSSIAATQFYSQVDQQITVLPEVTEQTCRLLKDEKKVDNKDDTFTAFFDFETFAKIVLKFKHVPYLGCALGLDGNKKSFIGADAGKELMKWCGNMASRFNKKIIRLIAHNCSYDLNFIMQHLNAVTGLIQKGSHMISCDALYWHYGKKFKVEIRDSYNLISSPLRDFGKMFKLEQGKEVMPYDLYNVELNKIENENAKQVFVTVDEALKYLKGEKEKQLFVANLKKWSLLREDGTYDIIEYSRLYCEIDCEVLMKGYQVFRGWMIEAVGKDIDSHLTIASLGHSYMKSQGCYDGVYELSGVPQRFIQGTVVGGRTMSRKNEMQFFTNKNVRKIIVDLKEKLDANPELFTEERKRSVMQDFDGVSLYPSAMNRMDGFLKGTPKVIQNHSWDWVKMQDGYFVDIKVTKIAKCRDFPILSCKSEDGIRVFTNDVVGKEFRVDKITLEDSIEFQGIEFEIIRGYYFNEGFNTKVKDTMLYLFNERLKKKKEKNPIEVVYKLVMNASYGKSIMKEIKEDVRIFNDKNSFDIFVSRQYNWIKSIVQIDGCDKYRVTSIKPTNKHFNIAQVGSSVLSWSKRIMNEVMCLADDLGTKIYYQDTDSMHLEEEFIPILAEEFQKKYGRELIGKQLGQFHSDFSMDYEDDEWNKKSFDDVHATESIFLGKKSYIDKLRGTNKVTGEVEESFHIRMKGIPTPCIWYATEKLGYKSPFELYQDLAKGIPITFDLTMDGSRATFKQGKDFSIKTLSIFKRTLKF